MNSLKDDDDSDDDIDGDEEDAEGEGAEDDPLGSGDDISEGDPSDLFNTENVVVCQYDKITRTRNKWKFHLKDGIMNLNGKVINTYHIAANIIRGNYFFLFEFLKY